MLSICATWGKFKIVKRALPADEKVNVVGQVIAEDRALINHIKAGQKFYIESVEKK